MDAVNELSYLILELLDEMKPYNQILQYLSAIKTR